MKTRPFLLFLVALVPAAEFARVAWATTPLVLVSAVVPAALLTGLALLLLRHRHEAPRMVLAVVFWGAMVAAFASSAANDLLQAWISTMSGEATARAVTPAFVAPIVEEFAKVAVLLCMLLLHPGASAGVAWGVLYGGLVGVGFAMTENLQYFLFAAVQGGGTGLGYAVYTRAVLGGLNHSVFTATAGAGLGWAAERRTRGSAGGAPIAVFSLGLGLAVAQHVLWNAVASRAMAEILCNPVEPAGACAGSPEPVDLFWAAPLIELAFIGPGVLLLAAALRFGGRRE